MNRNILAPSSGLGGRPMSHFPTFAVRGVDLGSRGGFALPAAILAMVALGILVTGGIQIATQESRIGQATVRTVEAFYVAESGMNEVLNTWRPADSDLEIWGDPETRSGSSDAGDWSAEIRQVDDRLFYIRSTGTVDAGGGATASRSMGVLARVIMVDLEPPAALLTMGTVRVQGSAQIRGNDQIPPGWDTSLCPDPLENLPAVVTNSAGTVQTSGGGSIIGTPSGHVRDPTVADSTFTNFGGMSWADLTSLATITLNGGSITGTGPTLTASGACNTANPLNWGDPNNAFGPCGNYFPIIHIQGSANIQSGGLGQGILLVDGDLDLRGGFYFVGVIIVQGSIGVQGGGSSGPRIQGAAIARNAELDLETFTGSSVVRNSRCGIRRAIQNNSALTQMVPITNRGWVDLTSASF